MKLQNLVPYLAAVAIGCGDADREYPELPRKTDAELCEEARQTFQEPDKEQASCDELADAMQASRTAFMTIKTFCPVPPSEEDRDKLRQKRIKAASNCPDEESLQEPAITGSSVKVNKHVKSCEALAEEVRWSAIAVAELDIEDATAGGCDKAWRVYEEASALMGSRYEVCRRTHSRHTIGNMASGPASQALTRADRKLDEICPRNYNK